MKRSLILISLSLVLAIGLAACDTPANEPIDSTEQSTEASATEQVTEEPTTEQPTTEEITTEEPTTEKQTQAPESLEDIKATAVAFIDAAAMKQAADNPQQDWSDFGGLTENEDGSVTALFRMGTNDVWDPYCYLIKQPTAVGDIMVMKYRVKSDFRVKMYMGTEGDAAIGASDLVMTEIFATEGDEWGYLIMDLREEAAAYDVEQAALGYLRIGLDMAESGDTVTIGYIAFFNSMDEVNAVIPY